MDKQTLDEYIQAIKAHSNKNYTGFSMHPEEGMITTMNDELVNIQNDLLQIDNALIAAGNQVYDLMIKTLLRLNKIHADIMVEAERKQDLQMLCGKYEAHDNVILLQEEDFQGNFSYENGTFTSLVSNKKNVRLYVIDVFGNGYEGNKYVYKDYAYTNKVLDTSLRENIVDNKITSYYEYSRITVSNVEDTSLSDFNKDNKEAMCTITLQAEEPVNEINISSDDSSVIVTNVAYSIDGINYKNLSIPYISINNKLDSYSSYGYVYGSGAISFPERASMFKITFQSTGYKDDEIAYEKVLLSYDDSDIYDMFNRETTKVKSARRHVIKINDISAGVYSYSTKNKFQTAELINQDTYAISVFANVYIPLGLRDSAVKFILTVNGIDYDVVPINSHLNGVKIIRFSTGNSSNPYTQRIGEKIKSAYLTVIFSNEARIAPKINNIKILLGGEL